MRLPAFILLATLNAGASPHPHWAFQPLSTTTVPTSDDTWPRNPIDHFVLARLTPLGITPNPPATTC
ncbi:MAG: hypothetical protein P8J87_14615 [Verrucomicrobiales bacterium]|nr:hypothetical protein [Verrucomicrobiales bacterium]